MAERASQAVDDVRREIHALREAAKGLIGRVTDAVNQFLDDPAKYIIEGLLTVLGIAASAFWGVVNRIGQAIDSIADDPLGFASNLLDAVGQGFQLFLDNIGTHLLGGFIDWLFSGLGAVGIQIPSDLSLTSIVGFFLELMGFTWERVRRLLAKHIGEENIALIEKAFELISDLMQKGIDGIVEMIQPFLNPQAILDQVIQAAVDFAKETIATQVAFRILALFNPVGAIIQAIEAIYKVLKWIFENAARIFSLVETVVGGITQIIAGNVGGMATAIELALVRLLVPVIDFVAGFAGLGDLPEKVSDTIKGFQEWIESILERVIDALAERAKSLLRSLGIGGDAEDAEALNPRDHTSIATQAVNELKEIEEPVDNYDELRSKKELQARGIEEKYTRLLESGIGLSIVFKDIVSDKADGDIDFEVMIAPNTTKVPGTIMSSYPSGPDYPRSSAPGIGNIQLHGKKETSNRNESKIWWTESEHILPFATGRALWEVAAALKPGRGGREDRNQTTIMIYYGAARIKTPDDNRTSRIISRVVEDRDFQRRLDIATVMADSGNPDAMSYANENILGPLLEALRETKDDAVIRTNDAIQEESITKEDGFPETNAERRAHPPDKEPPTPSPSEVSTAAERQYNDILNLVTESL